MHVLLAYLLRIFGCLPSGPDDFGPSTDPNGTPGDRGPSTDPDG